MMNSLLIKFYNNYTIIHIQHFPKPSYIKHYNIIRASHKLLTSCSQLTQLTLASSKLYNTILAPSSKFLIVQETAESWLLRLQYNC